METPALPRPVDGIYDVEFFGPEGAPSLLFEIPHGATEAQHYDALRGRLKSDLPDGLEGFFHINTDIGAPEVASAAARKLSRDGFRRVVILRSLVPRTFIDCNRALEHPGAGAVTPGLPDYIDHDEDRELLIGMHRCYAQAAKDAYAAVCGADPAGRAITLHTFAPRSIALTKVERSIVEDLRAAYQPGVYKTWPMRPEVDLITRAADDEMLASHALLSTTKPALERVGFQVTENATYRLFHATMAYWHSKRWPDRVLCLEMRRDLLAEEFLPFLPMRIADSKAERFADAIDAAVRSAPA